MSERKETTLEQEIAELLNRHSVENDSNTPDFILAAYVVECLDAYARAIKARTKWGSVPVVTTTLPDRGTPPDLH